MDRQVDILLGTYNGEKFLPELLNSIHCQCNRNWRILARDDGSADGTCEILDRYAAEHPSLIRVIEDPPGNLGIMHNFGALAASSDANYVMFCDQDDFWLPDKVQCAVEAMFEMELQHGDNTPLMAHGDLVVVDDSLHVIHPSFVKFRRLDPYTTGRLNRIIVENVVTGCAMIMNRPLKELGLPVPNEALMHDWWFAVVAAGLGQSKWLPEPKTLYRQHGGNVIGARRRSMVSLMRSLALSPLEFNRCHRDKVRAIHSRLQRQASVLLNRFVTQLGPEQRRTVQCFAELANQSFLQRRYLVLKHGFLTGSALRNAATLAYV